jgi:hypothetical protein
MVSTAAIGLVVVELETFSFATSPTVFCHKSALILITFRDGSFDRSRDVA